MTSGKKTEIAIFTNMCMVSDGHGRVVALDKVRGGYTGLTFPGGHAEPGESFTASVMREVREETGLAISRPEFIGVYQWTEDGVRNVIFLYKAVAIGGKLRDSEEGHVFWISLDAFRHLDLAEGMQDVITMMETEKYECLCGHDGNWVYWGELF